MADTFAIHQNTDAILKLASANEKLAVIEADKAQHLRELVAIADKAYDEMRSAAPGILKKEKTDEAPGKFYVHNFTDLRQR